MKGNFPTINDLLRDRQPFGEGHRIHPDNTNREDIRQEAPACDAHPGPNRKAIGKHSSPRRRVGILVIPGRDTALWPNPRLFCVHGADGGVFVFRLLAGLLGSEQPVYGIQSLRPDGKQAPHRRIEGMAANFINEVRALQPEGPYFLAGFSFGGTVAFEMAQQLHAQGQRVGLLALIDSSFPIRALDPTLLPSQDLRFVQRMRIHLDNLKQLGPIYILRRMKAIIKRAKKIKERIQEDRRSHIYQKIEEANKQALRVYVPQVYPGRLTYFWASEALHFFKSKDWRLDWRNLTIEGMDIHEVPELGRFLCN